MIFLDLRMGNCFLRFFFREMMVFMPLSKTGDVFLSLNFKNLGGPDGKLFRGPLHGSGTKDWWKMSDTTVSKWCVCVFFLIFSKCLLEMQMKPGNQELVRIVALVLII